MHGVVADFDDERGSGTVTADDGTSYPFHCTAIADGTRTIAVGTDGRPSRSSPATRAAGKPAQLAGVGP